MRGSGPGKSAEVVETNVLGVMNACHAVLPSMYERGAGHIVIISSTAGRIANAGEPVYLATKHATVGLADALRQAGPRSASESRWLNPASLTPTWLPTRSRSR